MTELKKRLPGGGEHGDHPGREEKHPVEIRLRFGRMLSDGHSRLQVIRGS